MKTSFAKAAALTLALGAVLPLAAQAEEAASPLSFNASVTTDYRYRGISQSRVKPALQGGADYAAANGFYIGTWASTIKWIKDAPYNGGASLELDVYAGYKTEIAAGLTLDVGVLGYIYPSNDLNPSANTTEVYGALSYGVFTAKYSHSTTNLFGTADSKGSGYLDLSATLDLGDGVTLVPHLGRQNVKHNSAASYTDYSLTLSKEYAGIAFSAAVVGTNTDAYVGGPSAKNLGKSGFVLSAKKSF
ncbi:TorF family putative porin [Paucibacter sp. DJ2R-2]|uniref:TorF family putative porin n=1 Tax=Paucibacter sp. DJ2R-2 TaxID=2893558 RepID=UPI0021E40E62|nr:TorF family putative porin [Paucibacter sp. DJ2R-2]MCV2421082.1 TorF family putative porin [Paucibacter sp. DJ4R-1]MCV2439060.1 TorF family putative porin [Paucibacter sp. DJ2R-2]